ncbi:hypothetical protein DFH08DRAFT_800187 [Mycena albidolilacea]|uniref:Uncharacterized protein n=1 Tax=Mycena albidolilacea TaxID=1033008 RepID=A0AAD7AJB0_9AGAR|nr:hypothetical protein DFH08DRAFT_800187 [Mycena albidolilacea]
MWRALDGVVRAQVNVGEDQEDYIVRGVIGVRHCRSRTVVCVDTHGVTVKANEHGRRQGATSFRQGRTSLVEVIRTAKNWERSRGETKKDSEGLVLQCQIKGLADAMRVWDDVLHNSRGTGPTPGEWENRFQTDGHGFPSRTDLADANGKSKFAAAEIHAGARNADFEVVLDRPAKHLHECLVGNFRQTRVGVQQMRVGVVFSSSFLSARDNLKLRVRLKWRSADQMMNYYWEYTRTYVFDKNELGG